jgi:hypothetical protein
MRLGVVERLRGDRPPNSGVRSARGREPKLPGDLSIADMLAPQSERSIVGHGSVVFHPGKGFRLI